MSPGAVRIDVRVIPRSRRAGIDGVRDGRLIVRVTAPPVDGAANDAAIEALAGALDLPRRALRIVAGASSRNKTIEVTSPDAAAIAARLRRPAPVTVPTLVIEHLEELYTVAGPGAARRRAAGRSRADSRRRRSPAPASASSRSARPPTCARPRRAGSATRVIDGTRPVARPRLRRRPHARRLCRRSARGAAASSGRRDVRGDRGGRRRHPVDGARHPRRRARTSWRPRRAAGSPRCSRRARRRARRRAATGSRPEPSCACCASSRGSARSSRSSSSSTFMGAHEVPPEYRGRQADFVRLIIDEMIPRAARPRRMVRRLLRQRLLHAGGVDRDSRGRRARRPQAAHPRRRAGVERRRRRRRPRRRAVGGSSRARAARGHRRARARPASSRRFCPVRRSF